MTLLAREIRSILLDTCTCRDYLREDTQTHTQHASSEGSYVVYWGGWWLCFSLLYLLNVIS